MIVFVHEHHDEWPNITQVKDFWRGFSHANRVSYFLGSKYLPKIKLNKI